MPQAGNEAGMASMARLSALCVLMLAYVVLAGCGSSTPDANVVVQPKDAGLRECYQTAFTRYSEYDAARAAISATLQSAYYSPDSEQLSRLEGDRRVMRALINTMYEIAYRPYNFTPAQLRASGESAQETVARLDSDFPLDDYPASMSADVEAFRKVRRAFIDMLVPFRERLDAYITASSTER